MELYRVYQSKICRLRPCDRSPVGGLRTAATQRRRRKARSAISKNSPRFDVRSHLYRMTGVDLTQIDGVDSYTALKVISEIGTDMTKWPSAKHFASWLGLSPNNRITGGRIISSRTMPSANRAAAAYAWQPMHWHARPSALGCLLRRKKAQLGSPKPLPQLPISWPESSTQCSGLAKTTWTPAEYYEVQYQRRALRAAKRRAAQLGYELIPVSGEQCQDASGPTGTLATLP